jgi:hypothetical protein
MLLGITYFLVSQQENVALRGFIGMGVSVSALFTVVAAMCFIYPAALGGLLATAFFVTSWFRSEG